MSAIKAFRKRSRLTQRDLARAVGVTTPTICRLEKGQRVPSVALIEKLITISGGQLQAADFVSPLAPPSSLAGGASAADAVRHPAASAATNSVPSGGTDPQAGETTAASASAASSREMLAPGERAPAEASLRRAARNLPPAAVSSKAAVDSRGASPELSLSLGGEGANSPSGASRAAHIRADDPVARPTHHRTRHHHRNFGLREIGPAGDGATDAGRALTPRDGASRDVTNSDPVAKATKGKSDGWECQVAPVRLRSDPADRVVSRLGAGRTARAEGAGASHPSAPIHERAAMVLVLGFFGSIVLLVLICMALLSLAIDWFGVADAAVHLFDFG